LYARGKALPPGSRSYWRPAVLFYALCAGGNLLLLWLPMAPPMVTVGSGKQWSTVGILEACALMSTLVMAPMSLLAWLRLTEE
jgi:hypothetical protein